MAPKRATRSTPVTTTPAPTATTTTSVTNAQLQAMIDQGVTAALAARDANRNGDDSHTSGTGGRRTERIVRECTYQDFMKCKPLYFKGTEGVVELTQWFERMETVFRISNCSVENQIKFSTCTLLAETDEMLEVCIVDLKVIGCNYHMMVSAGVLRSSYKLGHFKKECPRLKNNKGNHGNQDGKDTTPAKVYVVRRAGTIPDSNIVTGTFLLNNRYASVLFDTGADRSFVLYDLVPKMEIMPIYIRSYYDCRTGVREAED
ncbi:hypothetical protein Tco_1103557 [Tanacetum coccineum]